ncbi:hypothetical protein BBBOND_0109070 [Babesia bigemina]|uniref:Uncharacterized protein n=1 Tax=Babesia bigemina TaxID=5866 RepID=A0A061D6N8_BABBI|nr:hypothetical protein BBBOND_0109070 [Babesia bigemina]CDR94609.1 hypothetical protein BBBOND_0109070 [Babesia bigemina]|eukprot:XP_012766795.1 hypothetical protein BBBOND_0109070 [Babesia bigemina]
MVYNSLTDAPRNLKEAIDWLIAVKGDDSQTIMQTLGETLYRILSDKNVGLLFIPEIEKVKRLSKEFMEQQELKGRWFIKELLERFKRPMNKTVGLELKRLWVRFPSDYENIIKSRDVTPKDLADGVEEIVHDCDTFLKLIKNRELYNSAYSSEATWEASCSKNPEACALVLVGIAPMIWAGIQTLWDATQAAIEEKSKPGAEERFGSVLKALGYKEPECRAGMSGSDVRQALRVMDKDMLVTLYDISGFWAFY